MKYRWALVLLLAANALAERRVIFPPGVKTVGPYSPGILAGDFLYVSGQGARRLDGQMPATFDEQVTQCLENMKMIVETAGLTMEHVVYTHVYLENMANYDAMNSVYAHYFPRNPPARATLGIHHPPTDTPVEINAVAARDLARKKLTVRQVLRALRRPHRVFKWATGFIFPASRGAIRKPARSPLILPTRSRSRSTGSTRCSPPRVWTSPMWCS
jgi:2-iminobutanoate/2-iminopropanoate deaminase